MRYTRDCRVPFCTVTLASYHPFGKQHEAMVHQGCTCGWVGTSWTKHVAQIRRFRPEEFAGPIAHALARTMRLKDETT